MKANAPERIYCESDGLGNIVKVHNIKWPDDEAENIEYVRTDAFIEKAAKGLEHSLDNGVWIASDVGCREKEAIIEDFRRYLEE